MAKEKKSSGKGALPNKNVHLRISFLHQAALYLSNHVNTTEATKSMSRRESGSSPQPSEEPQMYGGQTRYMLNHMKGVSRKSVIRLDKQTKRKVCKGCDQLLDAPSSLHVVENESKGGKKPWADVLVIKCGNCGTSKRFPTNARVLRQQQQEEEKVTKGGAPTTSIVSI